MRKKNVQIQLQPLPGSATNLFLTSPRMQDSMGNRLDSMQSSYHAMITKQIRVGIQQQQSALPPSFQLSQFLNMFPFIMFSVLRQLHVIYLIMISGFLTVKYCEFGWNVLAVQISLTIGYICIEIIGRFFTFKYYTRKSYFNDADYYCWNKVVQNWDAIDEASIKVGQVLKIKKKINNNMEDSQQVDEAIKIRVPVNILPMRVPNNQKQVNIQTFDIDKQEASIKIPLIKNFREFFLDAKNEISYVKSKISDQCIIQYTFSNPISQSFEANLSFVGDNTEKRISNSQTIPRGAYFLNQEQLVGVVLFNLQQKDSKHMKHILGSRNSIATLLQKHLISIIIFNAIITLALLALNAIVTTIQMGMTYSNEYHCYCFNYFSLLSFSLNVIMYMILGLHQIVDSFIIRNKCNVQMNNYIKSVDEFGVADTFVMDEFSFVRKNILQVSSIEINEEADTANFDEEILLIIIQKSSELQAKFQNQYLSLMFYFRSKYGRSNSKYRDMIVIKDEKIDISGSVRLVVSFQDGSSKLYIIRFNEKVIFSVLESMTMEKQLYFSQKIMQGKSNGQLMLMVELLQINSESGIDVSTLMYEYQFKFLSLIKFSFIPHSRAVDFLRYLKNKYKIIIMTSSSFEYFENILVCSGLKSQNDYLVVFQQSQESDFYKDLAQKLDDYKKTLYQSETTIREDNRRRGSYAFEDYENIAYSSDKSMSNMRKTIGTQQPFEQKKPRNLIIAIHSSLIVYLGRPSIKQLLKQASKFSTYIIFYTCSQFQKELCSANIFKIFPEHIFLSNFAIDSNIFRISNLSVSISRHSASQYTTAIANSYQSLQKFISKECVTSIQLTTIIIKTHIFKNQCLVWSMMTANWLVFRAHYSYFEQEYSTYIMYFYNAAFTILPIFYYLIARPGLVGDIMVQDYKDYKLRYEHFKGVFAGIVLTYVTYSIIPEAEILMVFVAVMINCTFMGNFYCLVIDDSSMKRWQFWIILVQCVLSIGGYFLTLYVPNTHALFEISSLIYPEAGYIALFFCTVFVINPIIIFILFFFMSFHKSILTKDHRIEKKELQDALVKKSIRNDKVVARVIKSNGKQMRFRYEGGHT